MDVGEDMSVDAVVLAFGDGEVIDDDVGMFNQGHDRVAPGK